MRTVQQSIALFASLLLVLLLLLIVIYDCVGVYEETIIMDWYVGQWWCFVMPTYLMNLLSCPCLCPCPSVPQTIQAWTYDWVMLLIVLYDGVMLVGMSWYTYNSVTTVRDDDVAFSIVCWVQWNIYILSAGNDMNGNTTDSSSFSSLSTAAAVTVSSPWVRRVYSNGTQSGTARQYISLLFVKRMRHFFPFSLLLIILVLVGPFNIYYHFNSIPCLSLIR